MHATLFRRLAPSGQFPARGCQSHRPQRSRARPRHACRRRPGAARRGSPVKYSVASRSPPCVGFTVGARAWNQHEGAAASCSATQSHRIPSAHARPPHTRFAARKHLTAESPARRLRMAPHPSLMWQSASTELPQAVVQRCNLRSCLGSTNKPRAWFASSQHRS
jgi:hypothetical protein